jgi:sec-independent protein translocase protein TatA
MVAGPGSRYAGHMPNVGPWEIILLLLLALLLFGAKRLPEIGRSMGQGMREFKDSVSGANKHVDDIRAELETPTQIEPTVSTAAREHDAV